MKNKLSVFLIFVLIIWTISTVYADDWYTDYGSYYEVYNKKDNSLLFQTARQVSKGDQYISGDNKMYKIVKVNERDQMAYAEFVRQVKMPEIDQHALAGMKESIDKDGLAALILAQGNDKKDRRVGIYATHSAESYVPSDGTESIEGGGGILKVAEVLKKSFESNGVEAIFDNTSHEPHDAGAYKRSRRTAVQLMRDSGINTLIDVHRDAVPAEQYLTEIEGKPASKVRLVVGRRNQNFPANEELAIQIKAVADKMRPGLIKDIFYAKGDYNQDLTPRAMLAEMGTYEHTRQRAETTATYLSEVITTALFGGVVKEEPTKTNEVVEGPKKIEGIEKQSKGSAKGIIGLVAIVLIGGFAFLFLSSGGQEWKSKVSNFKQEFTNYLGRKKK
mgnify:FL=1